MRDVRSILCGLALVLASCGGPPADDGLHDADGDGVLAAVDCDDHDAAVFRNRTAYPDADRDGVGAGEAVTRCAGAALPAGWAAEPGDCDDADPAARTIASAYRDRDRDGVGAEPVTVCAGATLPEGHAQSTGDCDDGDAARWRLLERYEDADLDGAGAGSLVAVCAGAVGPAGWSERAGDCAAGDPLRFQELGYLYSDADGDGVLAPREGTVCSGAELPPRYAGFPPAALDCDDADATLALTIQGWADPDGDGAGEGAPVELCANALPGHLVARGDDCAAADPQRWQLLAYASVDEDEDGVRRNVPGSLCAGAALPAGYSTEWVSAPDCDDGDAARSTYRSGYADPDRDGVSSGSPTSVCSGAALPDGWLTSAGNDCAPADASAWRMLSYYYVDADGDGAFVSTFGSVCAGASLPSGKSTTAPALDCDDGDPAVFATVYAYADADSDGFGAGRSTVFCNAGETPAGYSRASTDCAAEDATRWRSVSYQGVDVDGDGHTVNHPGARCLGAEALPDPYRTELAGNDCDDASAASWRYVVLYPDRDGDGVGTTPRLGAACLGATLPAETSIFGFDPDDADPTRRDGPLAEDEILAL